MNARPYDLQRFIDAQDNVFEQVMRELHSGRKVSHWMWFVFPQLAGLGSSPTARFYAIGSLEEAQAYLHHPLLGERLLACTRLTLACEQGSARELFGSVDALKFRSSMTLFAFVAGSGSAFQQAIDKFFAGVPDHMTLDILSRWG